jgi:hypothetical protein
MSMKRLSMRRKVQKRGCQCHYCEERATTLDHIVPKALGGPDRKENLVPACQRCNEAKDSQMPTCRCQTCRLAVVLYGPIEVDGRVLKYRPGRKKHRYVGK